MSDSDPDSDDAFPAALSGSQNKAPGFAGGYLFPQGESAGAFGCDIKEGEAIQGRQFAAVLDRPEPAGRVHREISHGHLSARNEGSRNSAVWAKASAVEAPWLHGPLIRLTCLRITLLSSRVSRTVWTHSIEEVGNHGQIKIREVLHDGAD